MAALVRKIIHCDCDCFYASIEMRDNPRLHGYPLAIGGRPDQRGVVATCNYEARRFGIRSAMPMSQAIQRCPDLLIMPPAMEKYRDASRQIMQIYRDYTELVEPLSLDEAYLDVSATPQHQGSATLIAQEIRQRVLAQVGITVSAGVANSKFLAKIASDWNKPDGLFVVLPDQVDEFVAALPVARLFGVGKVTAAKLHSLGVQTCADLRHWALPDLLRHFGKLGHHLYLLSRGIDQREVDISSERKSLSVEETYARDLVDLAACEQQLPILYSDLQKRLQRAAAEAYIQKLYLKLRFNDFRVTTIECAGRQIDLAVYRDLLKSAYQRRNLPVRLIGLGTRLADLSDPQQLSLPEFE